jgi:voltage-gated potassium channel
MVTSKLASHLLARSAMYPGLSELVTDLVSGGEGSELYRVLMPPGLIGLTVEDLAARLRTEHRATLLAITRNGATHANPEAGFRAEAGDDLIVVAEGLGALEPLQVATGAA